MTERSMGNTQSLADVAELVELRLTEMDAALVDEEAAEEPAARELDTTVNAAVQWGAQTRELLYWMHYALELPDSRGRIGSRVRMRFRAAFKVAGDQEFSAEEIQQFGATEVLAIVHPYARETLASTLSRMGAKPVTLGMLRRADVLAS